MSQLLFIAAVAGGTNIPVSDRFLIFLLAIYGTTNIITSGKIFEGLRRKIEKISDFWGYWIKCPMCMGLWVGAFFSVMGWTPVIHGWASSRLNSVVIYGLVSSGWCWIVRVVLHSLGEDDL